MDVSTGICTGPFKVYLAWSHMGQVAWSAIMCSRHMYSAI